MADTTLIRCGKCGATNRVPQAKLAQGLQPVCGQCKAPLQAAAGPLTVTDATFAAEVERSPLPVVVDAWAPWCGPCRTIAPAIEELAKERAMPLHAWRRGRTTLSLIAAAGFFAACSGKAEPQPPRLATELSPAHCIESIEAAAALDSARCPTFLFESVTSARDVCREVGGKLIADAAGEIWALDINDDERPAYAFEYGGIVGCEEAWSIFSCGSLGCPKILYEQHDGAWRPIGEFYAYAMEQLQILDTGSDGYRTLRIGCGGTEPCAEYWFNEWTGDTYERTRIEVRGFSVDFENSIHGLYALVAETAILATPAANADVIGRYESGWDVAIVGTAQDTDYYYVSACNACESGFVAKSAVRVP
jgi:hypothetical protein